MKNVLVIGSTGQIGSELTMKIRNMYPDGNVVAGYIKGAEPKGVLLESGPAEEADVCNGEQLLGIVKKYNIDTIYNLAAKMAEEGIFVTGFYYPVVPKGQARIRVQLSAAHKREHLDKAIAAFIKVGKELGVIK